MKRTILLSFTLVLFLLPACRQQKQKEVQHRSFWEDSIYLCLEDSFRRTYSYFPRINISEEDKPYFTEMDQLCLMARRHREWVTKNLKDRSIFRDSIIILDPNPMPQIVPYYGERNREEYRKSFEEEYKGSINDGLAEGYIDTFSIYGKSLEEVKKKYQKDKLIKAEKDTACFGMIISDDTFGIPAEARFMLFHIHYAEIHSYSWQRHQNEEAVVNIYFIKDGDTPRGFYKEMYTYRHPPKDIPMVWERNQYSKKVNKQ